MTIMVSKLKFLGESKLREQLVAAQQTGWRRSVLQQVSTLPTTIERCFCRSTPCAQLTKRFKSDTCRRDLSRRQDNIRQSLALRRAWRQKQRVSDINQRP